MEKQNTGDIDDTRTYRPIRRFNLESNLQQTVVHCNRNQLIGCNLYNVQFSMHQLRLVTLYRPIIPVSCMHL